MSAGFKTKLSSIKALVFDVDGVLSKEIMVHPDGHLMRTMNAKDGYALKHAMHKGYIIGIITGGIDELVRDRFKRLGITDIYMGSDYKLDDFEDFYFKYELKPEEVLYMGDDVPDIQAIERAGIGACPADAAADAKQVADYISDSKGGEGCVRDVIEQVLRAKGDWLNGHAFRW